jgi:hypothetical protein
MQTDEEIKQSYYQYQSPTTNDASREFYLKSIKERAKNKGYKISGFDKMSIKVLKAIYNNSNNLSK